MGMDDALDRLKKALVESYPDFPWSVVLSGYQAIVEVEEVAIRAEMGLDEEEEEEESEEVGEGTNQGEVGRSDELVGDNVVAITNTLLIFLLALKPLYLSFFLALGSTRPCIVTSVYEMK